MSKVPSNIMAQSEGSHFLKNDDTINEGDTVIVYVNQDTQYAIIVKRGATLHMKYGALRHEFLIGKRYGAPLSATAGYVYPLRANPNLWTKTLPKKTQILYTPDIATILLLLEAKPGSIVCETGTGSGSLTHALATCVAPNGHVYSHDVEQTRVDAVCQDIKAHGLSSNATIILRDACSDGFMAKDCDCIFLDLPSPWLALENSKEALSTDRGGRLVSFSPCIEQVQQVVEALGKLGFVEIETFEIMSRKLKVVEVATESLEQAMWQGANPPLEKLKNERTEEDNEAKEGNKDGGKTGECMLDSIPFPTIQPTHTGYITSATLLPRPQII